MARAHGKVILLGEHAVVYGHPALAAGIERGASAVARRASEPSLTIGDRRYLAGEEDVGRAFEALLRVMDSPCVEVRVWLDLPAGAGLGASAAMGVAVARAIAEFDGQPVPDEARSRALVMEATVAWERVFHGNPSGIDASAATRGGCIAFTRGAGPVHVPLLRPLELAIAVAGPPASTKVMVEGVALRRAAQPARVDQCFESIGALVRRGRDAAQQGEHRELGKLMDENHQWLVELGVSTPALDHACEIARRSSALGAKLTGSGGGGCVIALASGSPEPVLRAWHQAGLECFATRVASGSTEEGS